MLQVENVRKSVGRLNLRLNAVLSEEQTGDESAGTLDATATPDPSQGGNEYECISAVQNLGIVDSSPYEPEEIPEMLERLPFNSMAMPAEVQESGPTT